MASRWRSTFCPVGGGFFFALPGVPDQDGFLGQGLVA